MNSSFVCAALSVLLIAAAKFVDLRRVEVEIADYIDLQNCLKSNRNINRSELKLPIIPISHSHTLYEYPSKDYLVIASLNWAFV